MVSKIEFEIPEHVALAFPWKLKKTHFKFEWVVAGGYPNSILGFKASVKAIKLILGKRGPELSIEKRLKLEALEKGIFFENQLDSRRNRILSSAAQPIFLVLEKIVVFENISSPKITSLKSNE